MFPLKNTEAYIHANGFRSTLGKELADRDAAISGLGSEIQALTNEVRGNWSEGGKNLFDPSAYSSYKQSDGSYRLTGSQANAIRVNVPKSLVGIECTASIYLDLSKESAPTQVYICATVSGTTSYGNRIGANSEGVTKITFTPQSVSDTIGLTFGSEGSNYFTMTDLQLEKGSEVTEYQPYAKTNVELTADDAILDISDSFYSSLQSGITLYDVNMHKQGKHVFGNFVAKTDSMFGSTSTQILTLRHHPTKNINSYLATSKAQWGAQTLSLGYFYAESTGGLSVLSYAQDDNFVKICLDYVTS